MKLNGRHCQCVTCGEYFNSPAGFDLHRYGAWTDRHCHTVEWMAGKGWSKIPAGFWITSAYAPSAWIRAPISGDRFSEDSQGWSDDRASCASSKASA